MKFRVHKYNNMKRINLAFLAAAATFVSCSSNPPKHPVYKKFQESPNTAVLTTKFVMEDHKPIVEIKHSADDGSWEFYSDDSFDDFKDAARVMSLQQMIKLDSSILEIADMKLGYHAHRNATSDSWTVEPLKEK